MPAGAECHEGNGIGMSKAAKAYIVGAYEHPTRKADTKSLAELHADVAIGALRDAGLTWMMLTASSAIPRRPVSAHSRWPNTSG